MPGEHISMSDYNTYMIPQKLELHKKMLAFVKPLHDHAVNHWNDNKCQQRGNEKT